MLVVLSALVAGPCVLASACRLAWAVLPTWLDPQLVLDALNVHRFDDWVPLQRLLATCDGAIWERDLFAAMGERDPGFRIALVNEQLRELDWRAQRWSRVPRVCASVATSAGLLFACVALVPGLGLQVGDDRAALVSAVDAFAVGIAGTSFCVAVHVRARRVIGERLSAAERLVDRLESLAVAA